MPVLGELIEKIPPRLCIGVDENLRQRPIRSLSHRLLAIRSDIPFVHFSNETISIEDDILLVSQREERAPCIVYDNLSEAVCQLSLEIHRKSIEGIRLTAVTGTNGKSTVVHMARRLHQLAFPHQQAFSLGTLGLIGHDLEVATPNTTCFPLDLHPLLQQVRQHGEDCTLFMETSSHALDQQRVQGLNFHAAAFTAITRDHLDYHKDFSSYRLAKLRLLDFCSGFAVVDADCPHWSQTDFRTPLIRCSLEDPHADLYCSNIRPHQQGTRFLLHHRLSGSRIPLDTPLYGRFNLKNALIALGLNLSLGAPLLTTARGLSKMDLPQGRLQKVTDSKGHIFIDYAHTPDALQLVLLAVKSHFPSMNVKVLFGCGGERDRGKRPLMGDVASELADQLILTSDNPRSENPQAIIDDILGGCRGGPSNLRVEVDREKAIASAIASQSFNDLLLICGKGHEDTQVTADGKHPFSDLEVCKKYL